MQNRLPKIVLVYGSLLSWKFVSDFSPITLKNFVVLSCFGSKIYNVISLSHNYTVFTQPYKSGQNLI